MARLGVKHRLTAALAPHPTDNPWLDLLRTVAIALVMLRHGQRALGSGADLTPLEALMINGWAGVDLFLVLSGYLVTQALLREWRGKGGIDLGRYAMRRVRRIVPAYVFVLTLVVIGYFPLFEVPSENLAARIGYHLLFLQDILPSDINVVFWSLGVEAKFYAMVPLLVYLAIRLNAGPALFLVVLALAALSPLIRGLLFQTGAAPDYDAFWSRLRSPFYACLEPFAFGFLVAVFEGRLAARLSGRAALTLFVALSALVLVYLGREEFLAEITLWDAVLQPAILALLFALLVAVATCLTSVRLPLKQAFRWGARTSYALYLVHFPLIPVSLLLSQTMGAAGFWLVYVLLSVLHALVILGWVEYPFMTPKRTSPAKAAPAKDELLHPAGLAR